MSSTRADSKTAALLSYLEPCKCCIYFSFLKCFASYSVFLYGISLYGKFIFTVTSFLKSFPFPIQIMALGLYLIYSSLRLLPWSFSFLPPACPVNIEQICPCLHCCSFSPALPAWKPFFYLIFWPADQADKSTISLLHCPFCYLCWICITGDPECEFSSVYVTSCSKLKVVLLI